MSSDGVAESLKRLDMTPLAIARRLGVSERTVFRWLKSGVEGAPAAAIRTLQQVKFWIDDPA